MTGSHPLSLSMVKTAAGRFPFSRGNIACFFLLYVISGVILFTYVGPWEAIRHTLVNGAIVAAWLGSAALILGNQPVPEAVAIRRPKLELIWALATLLIVVALAANHYLGGIPLPGWTTPAIFYGSVLLLYLTGGYPVRVLGLSWASWRGWLALLAAIAINAAAALVFMALPAREAEVPPQADLANQITGPLSVYLLLAGLLFQAALPEELLLRITIQSRLARFMPLGWAILLQALLFNAGHLPQHLIRDQQPWGLAGAYLLLIDNGLIGGYLWYRTRSLPLLAILHLFAYPRFGI
jgi:membrane protease YdiL (CAAX protease family)